MITQKRTPMHLASPVSEWYGVAGRKNTVRRALHHFSTEWVPLAAWGRKQKRLLHGIMGRLGGVATVSVTTPQHYTQTETGCWMICFTTLHRLLHYLQLTSKLAVRQPQTPAGNRNTCNFHREERSGGLLQSVACIVQIRDTWRSQWRA